MQGRKIKVLKLNGESSYQRLLGGKPETHGMRSGRVYLQPGEECGIHSTKDHEETLVFLKGSGKACIGENGEFHEIGEGKVTYIPPHTIHNIKNTGEGELVYIFCVAPVNGEKTV